MVMTENVCQRFLKNITCQRHVILLKINNSKNVFTSVLGATMQEQLQRTPNVCCNRRARISWSTKSKAALRPRRRRSVTSLRGQRRRRCRTELAEVWSRSSDSAGIRWTAAAVARYAPSYIDDLQIGDSFGNSLCRPTSVAYLTARQLAVPHRSGLMNFCRLS